MPHSDMNSMPSVEVIARRRYLVARSDRDKLFATCQQALQFAPAPGYLSCSAVEEASLDVTYRFSTYEKWRVFVRSKWYSLNNLSFHCSDSHNRVTIDCDLGSGDASILVAGESAAEVRRRLTELEATLACPRLPEGANESMRGLSRHYFVNVPITIEWVEQLVQIAVQDVGGRLNVVAKIRLVGEKSTEHIFRDTIAWQHELRKLWSEVESIYVWLHRKERTLSIDCDLPRQLVHAEAEALSYEEATGLIRSLEASLTLEEAPADPYRYRRFARFYEIKKWESNSAFAEAVSASLKRVFPTTVAFVSGYVTRGGSSQNLKSTSCVEAFLAEVGNSGPEYDSAELYVEGPRGKALGVDLNRLRGILEIRGSIDRKTFNAVAEEFENSIDLRLTKDVSPTFKEDGKRAPYDFLAKLVLAVIGLFVSVEFIKEAVPRDQLEIVFPREGADGRAKVLSGSFRPHWTVQRTRWWDTKELSKFPSARVVLIDHLGDVVLDHNMEVDDPPIPVYEGEYELVVTVVELRESDRVRLQVTQF